MTAQHHYECHFLQSLMARWPRRGRALVQFGCDDGVVLEHFWESGFDVTGVDTEHERLEAAKERMGHRADWHLGAYEATPFDDNEFDYVAVYHALEGKRRAEQEAVVKEALRLATRGVLVAVDNPWSLAHWNAKEAVHVVTLWRMVRRLAPSVRITWGSALHGPKWTWDNTWTWPWHWSLFSQDKTKTIRRPLFEVLHRGHRYSPLGASLFMCLDLGRGQAVTPLLLRTREHARAATLQAYPPTVLGNENGTGNTALREEKDAANTQINI